jgi:hypothetical protein
VTDIETEVRNAMNGIAYRNRPPLTITVPIQIERGLTPNGRVHWRTKSRLIREARDTARLATLEVVNPNDPYECFQTSQWPLTLHYVIGLGKRRRPLDQTNAIAAMKSIEDGIADILAIDDKHFVVGSMTQTRDPEGRGYVKVAIQPSEAVETEKVAA